MKHMILQEVLTSQHAAKRKSTLLVWPLVTEWTWNGRTLKGKRTPCLKAVIDNCMYTESCPSENCQGLSTKKDVQKYPKKEQQKDLHMPQWPLCCALPGARMEDAPRKSLKLSKPWREEKSGVPSTELVCMADIGEWPLWLNPSVIQHFKVQSTS